MATVHFYINRLKNSQASVMGRFTIDRDHRFKFATGERLPADQWDEKKCQAKTRYVQSIGINQHLSQLRADILQLYRDNKTASIDELHRMAISIAKFGQTE